MALSSNAHALLDLLNAKGRASNIGRLKTTLALNDVDYADAQESLVEAGLATLVGKGRIARANVGTDLSVEAEMLLAALPPDGSTVGNYNVRVKDQRNSPDGGCRTNPAVRPTGLRRFRDDAKLPQV